MKKAKEAEHKQQIKLDKNHQKAQEQAHLNNIRRLAIDNRQNIGAFKDSFSDPTLMPISSLSNAIAFTLINLTQAKKKSIESMLAKKSQEKDKKRALTKKKFNTICLQKISASNKEIKAFDNSVLSKTSKTSQRG